LDRPSRTIITGEGGSTPSRFKHIIQLPDDRWRRLTPVELERLSGFPPDHTLGPDISDAKRAFFIGNALVTGVVTRIGRELAKRLK
jgi:DNA (cytosine-5)-methyltransferase 1